MTAPRRPTRDEALELAGRRDTAAIARRAAAIRDLGHGDVVSYSRKVFIPLTHLCRDVCHYCTFARPPRKGEHPYMTPEEVLAVARAGQAAGCREALFTLGDKPELRYRAARDELDRLGHCTTLEYLARMARLVHEETGLLPHVNPGVMTADEIALLKTVAVSQGLLLESASPRLCLKGGPHYGSPDKHPNRRLETLHMAGELRVPVTSGLLVGIGETRREYLESLLTLRDLSDRYGHVQEIIVQNFRAKPGTKMANVPDLDPADLLWAVAVARIVFGPHMNIQAPPNLSPDPAVDLIGAGINDWGGVSPVTPDYVNPEAPWPHLEALAERTAASGKVLVERTSLYPSYIFGDDDWITPALRTSTLRQVDAQGYVRTGVWCPGGDCRPPTVSRRYGLPGLAAALDRMLAKATCGEDLSEAEIVRLFAARDTAFDAVCDAADRLRREVNGDVVTYVVNRNVNYTNICYFHCGFCAFSKGRIADDLRGRPYDLSLDEILRRVGEARARGATEVCMQGGIHPAYDGETYIGLCRAVKRAYPDVHIHAFSPLEVWHGASTLGTSVPAFLARLREAGLGSLPGTAAEILDDEIRAVICPDKIATQQWLEVVEAAHRTGLPTTSTIMFGHVDRPHHWARHLLQLRNLQKRTGGITEFVPLPFVHMEAPLYRKGLTRCGPTFRETVLMHAVARLALHPHVTCIQTSWVKLGADGAARCLRAGANDLGGTLMNESISRAAGAGHGEEMPPEQMEALIRSLGHAPRQRTTLYADAPEAAIRRSFGAAPLGPVHNDAPVRIRDSGGRAERPPLLPFTGVD